MAHVNWHCTNQYLMTRALPGHPNTAVANSCRGLDDKSLDDKSGHVALQVKGVQYQEHLETPSRVTHTAHSVSAMGPASVWTSMHQTISQVKSWAQQRCVPHSRVTDHLGALALPYTV